MRLHPLFSSLLIRWFGAIILVFSAFTVVYAQSPTAPTASEEPAKIDHVWQKASSKYDAERAALLKEVDAIDYQGPFRPDWEAVVTPVVDFALNLPEVDATKVVLHGWSFGGYLAPRTATAEHRLAACVSDCGPYDLYDAGIARVPEVLARQVPDGNRVALKILERALASMIRRPSGGWALRRNLWVHGVAEPIDYFTMAPEYTLKGREQLIQCPTFVCATEGDDLSGNAKTLADRLVCPTEYVMFAAADDVNGHCEMSARSLFHRRVYDWLDTVLGPASAPTVTATAAGG